MLSCVIVVVLQVWLTLADAYVASQKIDWEQTIKFTFNEKSNPDDNNLGMQIVKVGFLLSFIKTNIPYFSGFVSDISIVSGYTFVLDSI